MKKEYNKATTSDIPWDASFTPSSSEKPLKSSASNKPKVNAIGKKANSTNKSSSTSKSSSQSSQSKSKNTVQGPEKKSKTKLTSKSSDLEDLEKLNDENIRTYRFKSKRNKAIIVILSVLLAITIATIAIYLTLINLETNCNMIIHGNVTASYIVDGEEIDKFRSPANLQGNRVLRLDIKIRIDSDGLYNIRFKPECYQKGVPMNNTLIYEYNMSLFTDGGDGYYYSKSLIQGKQTITLCQGIILDRDYEGTLNVDNFRLDFHTYFEEA